MGHHAHFFLRVQKAFVHFVVVLLLTNVTLVQASQTLPLTVWQTPLQNHHGDTVKLADFHGKVIWLDFWASWCPPCKASFPWMQHMQTKYQDQGFVVVANNVDENTQEAKNFLASEAIDFTITYDPKGQLAEALNIPGMPTSLLIDREGNVTLVHVGFLATDTDQLEMAIRHALKQPLSN